MSNSCAIRHRLLWQIAQHPENRCWNRISAHATPYTNCGSIIIVFSALVKQAFRFVLGFGRNGLVGPRANRNDGAGRHAREKLSQIEAGANTRWGVFRVYRHRPRPCGGGSGDPGKIYTRFSLCLAQWAPCNGLNGLAMGFNGLDTIGWGLAIPVRFIRASHCAWHNGCWAMGCESLLLGEILHRRLLEFVRGE